MPHTRSDNPLDDPHERRAAPRHLLPLLLLAALAAGCQDCQILLQPTPPSGTPQSTASDRPPPLLDDLTITRGNTTISSFRKAKHLLEERVYHDHRRSLYCDCRFSKDKQVLRSSCDYKPRRESSRARRIEWEHAMPASWYGNRFRAWKKGHPDCKRDDGKPYKGRRCARKASKAFEALEADLYNLYPAVGEVNAARSARAMGEIKGERREFGGCDFEIERGLAEPRPQVRGEIARSHLYMNWAYPELRLLKSETLARMERWSAEDPPDKWELQRADRIKALQGNENPFIRP